MSQARQHDLFVHEAACLLLELPLEFHKTLGLPADVPLPPLFDDRLEAKLRAIVTLGDVTPSKARSAIKRGRDAARGALEMLETTMKMAALFDQMSFTREQIETLPDEARKAIIVQRRRSQLRIVKDHTP